MATFLINYADGRFYESQQLNIKTGLEVAGFDRAIPLNRRSLDPVFCAENRDILSQPRGAGYWLWKPYLIWRVMREQLSEGDVLFYSDSGCHFVAPIAPVVDILHAQPREKPVLLFTLPPSDTNAAWTKRDCFHFMGLDMPPYPGLPPIMGSFVLCRKSPFSLAFVQEWLRYAQDRRCLTDEPNVCGLPNYPEFRDHRHDQSILSLLARKHQVATTADISQWGDDYRSPEIPRIIAHTRWPG